MTDMHPFRQNKKDLLKNNVFKYNELFDEHIGATDDWVALQQQRKLFRENKEKYGNFCHPDDYDINAYFDFIQKVDALLPRSRAKVAFRSAILDERMIDIEHMVEVSCE